MFNKEKLDRLLNQPMNRQEFLRNVGLLAVSIIGLRSALNILATGQPHSHITHPTSTSHNHHGFGNGRFGV